MFIRLLVWTAGGLDVLLWLVCFFITVIFGAMEGILASIVLSLLWLLRKTARPQCCVLGRLPQTHIYRNVARFPMAKEEPGKRSVDKPIVIRQSLVLPVLFLSFQRDRQLRGAAAVSCILDVRVRTHSGGWERDRQQI